MRRLGQVRLKLCGGLHEVGQEFAQMIGGYRGISFGQLCNSWHTIFSLIFVTGYSRRREGQ